MTNPQKAKGDAAEREIATLINGLTGWPVRRKLGAGRSDDAGDLDGIPQCTAQVKNYKDVQRAITGALNDLETQRTNAGTTHAVAFIRRPGGRWIAVQTIEQWATSHREATGAYDDGHRPHRIPKEKDGSPLDEVMAWKCQECSEWISDNNSSATPCPVNWRAVG